MPNMCGQSVTRINGRRCPNTKYSLAPVHDSIVDVVLNIINDMEPRKRGHRRYTQADVRIMDEDGPRPMRNMRPAERWRTGAEKFYQQHHGVYEARGEQRRDGVARVNAHNKACPKMYDELDRRRSINKPIAVAKRNQLTSSRIRNLRIQKTSKKYVKRKPQIGVKRLRHTFGHKSQGCQYTCVKRLTERSVPALRDLDTYDEKMPGPSFIKKSNSNEDSTKKSLVSIKMKNKQESDLRNRSSCMTSKSSYYSFLSLDHEPMV